jgi:hypothetical protein
VDDPLRGRRRLPTGRAANAWAAADRLAGQVDLHPLVLARPAEALSIGPDGAIGASVACVVREV